MSHKRSPRRSPSSSPRDGSHSAIKVNQHQPRDHEDTTPEKEVANPPNMNLDFSPIKSFPNNTNDSPFLSTGLQNSPKKVELIQSPRSPRQFIEPTDSSPSGLVKPQLQLPRGSSDQNFQFKLFAISSQRSLGGLVSSAATDSTASEGGGLVKSDNSTKDLVSNLKNTGSPALVTPRKKAIRIVKEDSRQTIKVSTEEDTEEVRKCREDGIYVTKDQQGRPTILGGTTEKIINQLLIWLITEPKRKDVYRLLDIFFLTYVQFHSSEDLLLYVMGFWKLEVADSNDEDLNKQRSSIIMFLSRWFETSITDFQAGTLTLLQQFLNLIPKSCKILLKTKLKQVTQPPPEPTVYLFEPLKDLKLVPGKFGFLDLKPKLIADQWTLLDLINFQRIKPIEFIQQDDQAPNYVKMLSRAAMFQRWVASEIVQNIDINKRIETYKKFIQVALLFLENNNFNGLMTLWGGLNMGCVSRLVKTKKKLPSQTIQIMVSLQEKLSERGNFAQLRKAMEKQIDQKEPVIPWFELINKYRNWNALYGNFLDTVRDGTQPILNFAKMTLIGDQMLEFINIQKNNSVVDLSGANESKTDIIIKGYFEHLPTYDDDVLYKFSNQCEPSTNSNS